MRKAWRPTLWTLALLAAAGAAWWTSDQWLPQVRPLTDQAWGKLSRPGVDSLPPEKKAAQGGAAGAQGAASAPVVSQPRKCVQGGRTIYTDEKCPPGSEERALDGGAVTSLPRSP